MDNVGTNVGPVDEESVRQNKRVERSERKANPHSTVGKLIVGRLAESSRVGIDLCVTSEEVDMGNLNFVELQRGRE